MTRPRSEDSGFTAPFIVGSVVLLVVLLLWIPVAINNANTRREAYDVTERHIEQQRVATIEAETRRDDLIARTNPLVERTYGLDIVEDIAISDTPGDLTNVKVKLDGNILTCDVLAETVGFTVTCDSPDGRITLKEK